MEQLNVQQNDNLNDSKWPHLIARVRDLARQKLRNNTDGIAVVWIGMAVSNRGDPIVWVEPELRRIEPSKDAAQIIIKYLSDKMGEMAMHGG